MPLWASPRELEESVCERQPPRRSSSVGRAARLAGCTARLVAADRLGARPRVGYGAAGMVVLAGLPRATRRACWSPGSYLPDGRAYPPFWKAGHLRNTSPRFKKSMAGAFAFILFVCFVGATADDKPTGLATTATAADSRETPSATPTAEATPTGTPAAEPAPASSPEPPPPPAAPSTTDQIIAQAQPSTALALLATLEVKGGADAIT